MRFIILAFIILQSIRCFSQQTNATKRSIKENGYSIEFSVLTNDQQSKKVRYDFTKTYFWSKAQSIIATQGGSSGVLLDGKYTSYYEDNHQLFQSGDFVKGLKNGTWKQWRKNGTLVSQEMWKDGELKGKQLYFDNTGKKIRSIEYRRCRTLTFSGDSIVIDKGKKRTIELVDSSGSTRSVTATRSGLLHGKQMTRESGKRKTTYYYKGRQLNVWKKKEKHTDEIPSKPKRKKKTDPESK